jgi:hypothetical protein
VETKATEHGKGNEYNHRVLEAGEAGGVAVTPELFAKEIIMLLLCYSCCLESVDGKARLDG